MLLLVNSQSIPRLVHFIPRFKTHFHISDKKVKVICHNDIVHAGLEQPARKYNADHGVYLILKET